MSSERRMGQLARNLEQMKKNGATQLDIREYLEEKDVTPSEAKELMKTPAYLNAKVEKGQINRANVLRQALGQGAAYGFGDEIEGAVTGTGRYLADQARGLFGGAKPTLGFVDSVYGDIDRVRAENEAFRKANPYLTTALQVGGGALTGPLGAGRAAARNAAAGLVPKVVRGMGRGALQGGLSGLGRAEGDFTSLEGLQKRGLGLVTGAGTGLVVGGGMPLVQEASRAILDSTFGNLPGASTRQAARDIRRGADDDEVTAQMLKSRLSKMPSQAIIPDATSRHQNALRDIYRRAALTSGGKRGSTLMSIRQEGELETGVPGQGERMLGYINTLSPEIDLKKYLNDQKDVRRTQANRTYGDAYSAELQMTDELKRLLQNKKLQEQWSGAQDLMKFDNIDLPDAVRETKGGIIFTKPTLEIMDYIKQSMDDKIGELYKSGQSQKAGRMRDLRDDLIAELDNQSDAYKEARSLYAGTSAVMEAAELGDALVLNPKAFDTDHFDSLGDHEMAGFRIGVANAYRLGIRGNPKDKDNVKRLFNNDLKRTILIKAFGDTETFAAFEKAVKDEEQMFLTGSRTLTGSRSAPILMDQGAQALSTLDGGLSQLITSLVIGGEGAPAEEVASETIRLLSDPASREEAFRRMDQGSPVIRRNVSKVPVILGNILAQQSPRPFIEKE